MKSMKMIFALLVLIAACSLFAAEEKKDAEKTFTMQELAKFNGQNGAAAYVAIDGIVYDMSSVDAWKSGSHKGFKAGTDISEAITKSPHKKEVVKKLKAVGKLKK